ncbi:TPA: hypothetical protein QCX35_004642 [Bacillus toyonensis]|uniref:hypothetical protein n=1 Tax=Bacillus TaxID=1386 RepID=UPI0018F75FCD|nr:MULTISPECIES: hypothetical protein [Bacillus]MBJ8067559.1 hypothetical protein [Bacillus cereus group sp. N15]MCS3600024.1 hypothetical protein [Bacillus sp. JUb91]HDR7448500.1 hypothetical protein [Bacillus toyonensis]
MIKVIVKLEILEKHREYIINKKIDKKLKKLQRNTSFFKIEYLNKLIDINKEKNYSTQRLFLKKFTFKEQKQLLKQHVKFINYLIKEIDDLKSSENVTDSNNIFLANPKGLSQKKKDIERKFIFIYEFLKLQSKLQGEEKKRENTYASELRDCLGYSDFSNEKMNYYYKYELERIRLLRDIDRYKNKLMLSKVPNLYSEDNLNSIKQYILADINEINHYDKENDVLNEFLQVNLYQKVEELPVINSKGKSIGIGKFCCGVKGITDNAYHILKNNRNIQSIGISIRNIDVYNAKYKKEWGAYHFLMDLGIKSCPYCNRQYITPMYSENGKVRADLDHFYNKAKYPYFSISIFNLVPSCKFCNSSLKGTEDFEYNTNLSPYEDGFGDRLKFSFEVKSYEDFLGDSKIRIYLQEKIGVSIDELAFFRKAKGNVEAFQIENLYNYHTGEAMELIGKRIEYSDSYIENLIKDYNEKLFRNENEVLEAILGYQVEDECLSDKNLTKFTRDICEELGFIFRKGTTQSHKDIQLIVDKYKK